MADSSRTRWSEISCASGGGGKPVRGWDAAGFRGDCEPWWHGQAHPRHLGEVGSLASQQVGLGHVAVGEAAHVVAHPWMLARPGGGGQEPRSVSGRDSSDEATTGPRTHGQGMRTSVRARRGVEERLPRPISCQPMQEDLRVCHPREDVLVQCLSGLRYLDRLAQWDNGQAVLCGAQPQRAQNLPRVEPGSLVVEGRADGHQTVRALQQRFGVLMFGFEPVGSPSYVDPRWRYRVRQGIRQRGCARSTSVAPARSGGPTPVLSGHS